VKDRGETTLHVIYIDYLAKLAGGELKAGSDVGEAIWASREEIPRIWEELHDDTKRLLEIAKVVSGSREGKGKSGAKLGVRSSL